MSITNQSPPQEMTKAQIDAIPTYLGWSIFSFLFCCFPALIAIYFGWKTKNAKEVEAGEDALHNSGVAFAWMIIAFAFGLISLIGSLAGRIR